MPDCFHWQPNTQLKEFIYEIQYETLLNNKHYKKNRKHTPFVLETGQHPQVNNKYKYLH